MPLGSLPFYHSIFTMETLFAIYLHDHLHRIFRTKNDPVKEDDSFCFTVSRSHAVGHALLSRTCLWYPDTALFSKISGFHSF